MAVFRIEKTRDYTVMSNHHLRDMSLSLKAKGLLSLMLSLPENWDYTMKGLSRICKDGIDSISGGIRELEEHGYLIRERVRGANGQLGSIEYTILEQPKEPTPAQEKPIRENPVQANPTLVTPVQEEPVQLNKDRSSNDPSRTDLSSTEISNPIPSNPSTPAGARMGTDRMGARECYREVILDNIEYSYLVQDSHIDREQLDEIVDLIVDTVCSARKVIRIAGDDYPAEVVKSRFMKLDSSHVQYVMDCIKERNRGLAKKRRLLSESENRITELDMIFKRLYEDNISGKLTDERFHKLSTDYEAEQAGLQAQAAILREEIEEVEGKSADVDRFLSVVRQYTDIPELTPRILHEFVEKIVIHAATDPHSKINRRQEVDIYYKGIGILEMSKVFDSRQK